MDVWNTAVCLSKQSPSFHWDLSTEQDAVNWGLVRKCMLDQFRELRARALFAGDSTTPSIKTYFLDFTKAFDTVDPMSDRPSAVGVWQPSLYGYLARRIKLGGAGLGAC